MAKSKYLQFNSKTRGMDFASEITYNGLPHRFVGEAPDSKTARKMSASIGGHIVRAGGTLTNKKSRYGIYRGRW